MKLLIFSLVKPLLVAAALVTEPTVLVPLDPTIPCDPTSKTDLRVFSSQDVIEAHRSHMISPSDRDKILTSAEIKDLEQMDDFAKDKVFLETKALAWKEFSMSHPDWKKEQYDTLRKTPFEL